MGYFLFYNKMLFYWLDYAAAGAYGVTGMADIKEKKCSGFLLNDIEADGAFVPDSIRSVRVEKPSLLLHSCCGPCSTSVIERLAEEFNITVFFYNP